MKKVLLGLSGGVDSSVAIIELQKNGYLVDCMYMRNWDATTNNDFLGNPTINDEICPQESDYQDALKVAKTLNVKLMRVDFIEEYWQRVFTYFLDEYAKGRTPNPDIMCNKEIKFKAFLEKAQELGYDYIAMGHYARVEHTNSVSYLLRGIDRNKDQSYFLAQLSQSQLRKALFPIGHLTKPEVRELAKEYDLSTATKKDSTGVCFIGERNFKQFLQNYIPAQSGRMQCGEKDLGGHDGVMYYTIGQRKGLGIGGEGDPWYVVGKDINQKILYVSQDETLLLGNKVIVNNLNFINRIPLDGEKLTAKFRYRQPDVAITIKLIDEETILVTTDTPTKAITPGQACVFYDGDYCLGGGTIEEVFFDDIKRNY